MISYDGFPQPLNDSLAFATKSVSTTKEIERRRVGFPVGGSGVGLAWPLRRQRLEGSFLSRLEMGARAHAWDECDFHQLVPREEAEKCPNSSYLEKGTHYIFSARQAVRWR
jgi:hypothetical protein